MTKEEIENHLSQVTEVIKLHFPNIRLNDIYIAGGAIRSLYCNEVVQDYDIYFKNIKSLKHFLNYCLTQISGKDIKIVCCTKNAITFQCRLTENISPIKIQFIIRQPFATQPMLNITRFDFTNCMAYYKPYNNKVYFEPEFLIDCDLKRLKYNKSCYFPINSIRRMFRFMRRGWKISIKEFIKVFFCGLTDFKNYKEIKTKYSAY